MTMLIHSRPVMPMSMGWEQRYQMDVAVAYTARRDELPPASQQVRCLAARNQGVQAIAMIQRDALACDDKIVVVVLPLNHPARYDRLASIVDISQRGDAPLGLIRIE